MFRATFAINGGGTMSCMWWEVAISLQAKGYIFDNIHLYFSGQTETHSLETAAHQDGHVNGDKMLFRLEGSLDFFADLRRFQDYLLLRLSGNTESKYR
jgi:hypothetical protein